MHMDMLRDSLTHVDTVSDTNPKDTRTHHTHACTHMLIITDKLTLIWLCSGFPDMTSCCSGPEGTEGVLRPSGRHADQVVEGATRLDRGA